jgi:AraC-like DNA-binding protein
MGIAALDTGYVELPLGTLDATRIEAVWRCGVAAGQPQRVLPDGRMDLVAHCVLQPDGSVASVRPVVAGPADTPTQVVLRSNTVLVGVRFHIGWGGVCLGVVPRTLRNQALTGPCALALLGPLADGVVRADSLPRVQAALCAVASTLAARAVVTAAHGRALQAIAQMKQRIQAGDVGDAPGAESPSRTLRRDMVEAAGYPLRTLSGVLRFQRAMELLDTGVGTLSDVAMAAGYADQAHMTREFRRFGGFTPAAPAPAPLVRLFV